MDDRHGRLPKIYQSARELQGEERFRYIQNACGSDAVLRRQIEILLQHEGTANSLLDEPAIKLAGELMWESETAVRLPGTQVGPYQLLALVGSGGMGEVYRARDTRLGRMVALKFLHPHLLVDPEVRRRLRAEARAVAGLSHRNIVALFDIGELDGSDFLVMEYIEGQTLKDLIETGTLPLDAVIHCGIQIAHAVGAAHAAGVIHRDIKPANVTIAPDFEVKVLDFGLAKSAALADDREKHGLQHASVAGMIVGTVSYMSPEHVA